MDINATIQTTLQCESHDIVIEYNEFIPTPFDAYIIASLIKNTKNKKTEIYKYIDDISGDGSLNKYFKDLYEKMADFDNEDIENILINNLYPVDVIDNSNKLLYYPTIDITQFNGRFYKGSLEDDDELIESKLINSSDKSKILKSIKISEATKTNFVKERFPVNITKDYAFIEIKDINEPLKVTYNQLQDLCNSSAVGFDIKALYKGTLLNDASGSNWFLLTENIFRGFINSPIKYYGADGFLHIISVDKIETVEILKVTSNLLFYRRTLTPILPAYSSKCSEALNYLIDSKCINEYSADNILPLLKASDKIIAHKAVSSLLATKDSYKLVDYALHMFFDGLTDGWNVDALRKMKARCSHENLKYLYAAYPNIGYTIRDFMYIDDEILNEEDRKKKLDYLSQVDTTKNEINLMLGELVSSGVREKIKKLAKKDQLLMDFKKFLDQYLGHNKVDITIIDDLDELQKHYTIIKNNYDRNYPIVRKRLESLSDN